MKEQTDKTREQNLALLQAKKAPNTGGTTTIVDNRPSTGYQRKLHETMNNSVSNKENPIQQKANKTGLPDNLKSGIENLSGYSMDDVKVHYNSSKPAQLQAHAYAQGTNIHLAPGQEKHLAHEAWHVVQQKQGRVTPTRQLKGKGVNINDDAGLEKEADVMGQRAMAGIREKSSVSTKNGALGLIRENQKQYKKTNSNNTTIQRYEFQTEIEEVKPPPQVSEWYDKAQKSITAWEEKQNPYLAMKVQSSLIRLQQALAVWRNESDKTIWAHMEKIWRSLADEVTVKLNEFTPIINNGIPQNTVKGLIRWKKNELLDVALRITASNALRYGETEQSKDWDKNRQLQNQEKEYSPVRMNLGNDTATSLREKYRSVMINERAVCNEFAAAAASILQNTDGIRIEILGSLTGMHNWVVVGRTGGYTPDELNNPDNYKNAVIIDIWKGYVEWTTKKEEKQTRHKPKLLPKIEWKFGDHGFKVTGMNYDSTTKESEKTNLFSGIKLNKV